MLNAGARIRVRGYEPAYLHRAGSCLAAALALARGDLARVLEDELK